METAKYYYNIHIIGISLIQLRVKRPSKLIPVYHKINFTLVRRHRHYSKNVKSWHASLWLLLFLFCIYINTYSRCLSISLFLLYVTKAKTISLEKMAIAMEILDFNYPIPGFNYPIHPYFIFVIYRRTSRVS